MEMVLCGCRFQDSSVFAMCGALRVFEYARMSRACAGMLRFAFWSVVEAGGVCSLKTRYRARRCSGFWLTCNLKFGTSLRGSRKGKRCPRDKKRCIHFDDPFTTQESSNFATLLEHNRSLVDIALKGEFTPRPVFTRYRGLFVLGASFRVCNLHRASLGFSSLDMPKSAHAIGVTRVLPSIIGFIWERLSKATWRSCCF